MKLLWLLLLLGACEDAPPGGRDAGADLAAHDGAAPADLRAPADLAEHVVDAAPPSALSVAFETGGGGPIVRARWRSAAPALRLLRRRDALPLGPFDPAAVVVYDGGADVGEVTHRVRALIALQPYFYAAFACDGAGGCEAFGVQVPFELTLGQALLDGGYTIYLRHALADRCGDALALGTAATTASPGWWRSCERDCTSATAAQLGEVGLAQASALGEALSLRAIPVGLVRTSEFCRARQTAEALALPGATIVEDQPLTYFVYAEDARCAQIAAELALPPPPGSNALLVGHADFAGPCDPLAALAAGEAAVFRPTGPAPNDDDGDLGVARLIELVGPSAWAGLP